MSDAEAADAGGADGTGADATNAVEEVTDRLRLLREDPAYHWVGLLVAIVVGVALSTVHWLGLVAGGALVGLLAASVRRAVLAALGFGVIVLLVWVVLFAFAGSLGEVLATGRLVVVGTAMGLLAPVLGSLARGIV